jgi:hypothetical protein
MLSISGLGTTLFLGGWSAPLRFLDGCLRGSGSFGKVMLSICVFIWMRGTLPRLRQDQLMNFAWKFVLPLTLLNLFVAALWRFMGDGWERWVVCSAILLLAYVLMARVGCKRSIWAEELPVCGVVCVVRAVEKQVLRLRGPQNARHRSAQDDSLLSKEVAADERCVLSACGVDGGGCAGGGAAEEYGALRAGADGGFCGTGAAVSELDAQFAGFAQILVYIGAVAILVVFAILLTRGSETPKDGVYSRNWLAGIGDCGGRVCGAGLGGIAER